MELNWIEDFLTLARLENFTAAAEKRCVTQPAFSRRIQQLEDWCGTALFNRNTRPVTLTQAGQQFVRRAETLYGDILDTRRLIKSGVSHYEKPQRIYTTNTLATCFFADYVSRKEWKNYSLIVGSVTGALEALRNGRCDTALIPAFTDIDDGTIVGEDRLVPVIRKDRLRDIDLMEGRIEGPVMLYTPGTAYGEAVDVLFRQRGLTVAAPPLCESASAEALAAMARAGFGLAWIPGLMLDKTLVTPPALANCSYSYKIMLLGAD